MKYIDGYELVCGLEIHVELKTDTKIFCSCPTKFGALPNTQCCPICSGMPGTLPVLNKKVVELAILAGLALNCDIAEYSKEDRKNYFYPDLPKAYQISQFDRPLCTGGYVDIISDGSPKRIGITRIHIEEDAGKLIHENGTTFIDLNRCGVPLIEIVTEPDIRSEKEAGDLARKIRSVLLAAGVSDCKMNEGSLRCDVNLSVRKIGDKTLGTRSEIKNLNSFMYVEKAVEYEYLRQVELIKNGGTVLQETRRFDAGSGKTFSMRQKENAADYRYFPDPDLPPIFLSKERIEDIRRNMPKLPDERKAEYINKYALSEKDAERIATNEMLYEFFDRAVENTDYPKILSNLILGELMSKTEENIFVSPEQIAKISNMAGDETINSSTAKKLIGILCESYEKGEKTDVEKYVFDNELFRISDVELLKSYMYEVFDTEPKLVDSYRMGKTAAKKAIMGKIMSKTGGRANAALLDRLFESEMSK